MNIETLGIAVAITTGLVQVVKDINLPGRFAPLASVIIGIGSAMLLTGSISLTAVTFGIIAGLTASGLYSGVKATTSSAPSDATQTAAGGIPAASSSTAV